MPRVVSPARQIMIDRGIDPDEMASLVGCGRDKLSRYMTGERQITAGARHRVIARFGPSIQILINAIDQARIDMEDRNPWDRELGRRRRRLEARRARRRARDRGVIGVRHRGGSAAAASWEVSDWGR